MVYNRVFDQKVFEKVNKESLDLLEDFLAELRQKRKSQQTITQYRTDMNGFLCWVYNNMENRSVLDLSRRDFRRYSIYLVDTCGVSSARHNRLMSVIRSMLTYAEEDDELDYASNAARRVHGIPGEPVREIHFLTDEQILAVRDELMRKECHMQATLLMLAYDSAGRRGELAQVNKQSFLNPAISNTNEVIGKRRKKFRLLYFSGTKACARAWLEQRGEDSIDSMWVLKNGADRRVADRENLYEQFVNMRDEYEDLFGREVEFGAHSLRHSALTNMKNGSHYVCRELGYEDGIPLDKLQLMAHHESIETTRGYLPDTSEEELEETFKVQII